MRFVKPTTGILIAGCFGFALFGVDGSLMGGILTNKLFLETFDYPNDTIQGQITGLFDLGCFVGALFTFVFGDKFGRRTVIMAGCIIHAIGGAIQCSSFSVAQLIVGRIVAGFGNGFITVVIPVWLSETIPAESRGRLMVILNALNIGGVVIITFLNFGMRYIKTHFSWRFPLGFQILFALGTLALTPLFPESPRWLISKGHNEKGKTSVGTLLCQDVDSPDVLAEFTSILVHLDEENRISQNRGFRELFYNDRSHNVRRILLGASSQFFQQMGGVNLVLYYMPVLFQNSLGLSESLSLILTACNSVNLFCSIILASFLIIQRAGRKTIMIYGAAAIGICFLLMAIGLALDTHQGSILSIVFMFIYYNCFGFSWNYCPWLYPPEINSQEYRNIGASVATATNWICNYIIVMITPIGIANIGWKFYLIFAILNFSWIPFIYFFFEETKGLSLEEIDEIFLRKNPDSEVPIHEDPKTQTEHIE